MYVVVGQAVVSMEIGGVDVIEDQDNLDELMVMERAGTELPVLETVFRCSSNDVMSRINESNRLVISLGSDDIDLADSEFLVQDLVVSRSGRDYWSVYLNAIRNSIVPWAAPRVEISDEMSGLRRVREVAERADAVESNVEDSQDRQRWIQHGVPDKVHVDSVLMHCDLPGSFPMTAHTLDNFRIYDAVTKFRETEDWWLSTRPEDATAGGDVPVVLVDTDGYVEQLSGFFNSVGARGQTLATMKLDNSMPGRIESEGLGLLSQSGADSVSQEFAKTSNRRRYISRNVHPRYWETWAHNRTQLELHSSSVLTVSWRGRYTPLRPLDKVYFGDRDIHGRESIAESYSGHYVVCKVSRTFKDNNFQTTAQLCRESLNYEVT